MTLNSDLQRVYVVTVIVLGVIAWVIWLFLLGPLVQR
jgi:hypothetical protein